MLDTEKKWSVSSEQLPMSSGGGGTVSAPVFMRTTQEIEARLENDHGAAASEMRHEARELARTFAHWQDMRPSNEEKVATIQRLFDLQRRAMDHLLTTAKTGK
jgi:hypothetical protein